MGLRSLLFGKPAPRQRPSPAAIRPVDPMSQRMPARDFDKTLSATAEGWMDALPPRVRPVQLAETFPRICNRLALVWRDAALCERIFDDLLVDRRGGRQGFPPPITQELLRLHEYHERRHGAAPPDKNTMAWELQSRNDR